MYYYIVENEVKRMNEFKTNIFVDIHDVDYNGIAKTSSLMRYIQSAAQAQLTENSMSYEELRDMKRCFVLSRIRLEVSRPIRAYTPVTAITYPCESRGYSFLRCYELIQDGISVAKAISVWALIDTESRALVRVNDFDLNLPLIIHIEFIDQPQIVYVYRDLWVVHLFESPDDILL